MSVAILEYKCAHLREADGEDVRPVLDVPMSMVRRVRFNFGQIDEASKRFISRQPNLGAASFQLGKSPGPFSPGTRLLMYAGFW